MLNHQAHKLETRLGPLAWRSSGEGPPLVFFAGALANQDLWRDVVATLEDRYRCITIDLPLGSHPWPVSEGADRSVTSLAGLILDCLELLNLEDATVIANDTAGGLLLLSLASGHPALDRVGRLVLTNCETYEKFPPDQLKRASAMSRRFPRLAGAGLRLQLRFARRVIVSSVAATGLDPERQESFFGPALDDPGVAEDLIAVTASFRPELLLDASKVIPQFDRPVMLVWGDSCKFFPIADAERLLTDFPNATLVPVPGARTWVPVDNPDALSDAITGFVPVQSEPEVSHPGSLPSS